LQEVKQMKKIQILDIKLTRDNGSVVSQLSKKEIDSTVGGDGRRNCVVCTDGTIFCNLN
jgi:hypothetical protein